MNDGGPAFPATNYIVPQDLEARHVHALGKTQGMSLRDYLAAHAPQPPDSWHGGEHDAADVVEWRWSYADAMLAARDKPTTER